MVEATSESHQYDSVTGVRLPKTWRHGNLETSRSSPESRARVLHAMESWKPWKLTEINKNLSKLESTTSSICRTVFQVSGNPEMCTIHRKPGNFLQKLELLMWQRLATNHIASHHIYCQCRASCPPEAQITYFWRTNISWPWSRWCRCAASVSRCFWYSHLTWCTCLRLSYSSLLLFSTYVASDLFPLSRAACHGSHPFFLFFWDVQSHVRRDYFIAI